MPKQQYLFSTSATYCSILYFQKISKIRERETETILNPGSKNDIMCSCWINQNTTIIIKFLTSIFNVRIYQLSILLTQTAIFTLYNKPKKAKFKHDLNYNLLFYSNINQTIVISIILEGGDAFGHTCHTCHHTEWPYIWEEWWEGLTNY